MSKLGKKLKQLRRVKKIADKDRAFPKGCIVTCKKMDTDQEK